LFFHELENMEFKSKFNPIKLETCRFTIIQNLERLSLEVARVYIHAVLRIVLDDERYSKKLKSRPNQMRLLLS
jgi:hypothetical protein